jgi:cytidyltransferase-like protein
MKIVLVTGGFDPLHSGHIEYFKAARALGDQLIVGVNSDAWLVRKKGQAFMPLQERLAIIRSLKYIDGTLEFNDNDGTAINAIEKLKLNYPSDDIIFANGGDRTAANIPEMEIKDVTFKFGVGGEDKKNSSSWILEEWKAPKTNRAWGYYRVLHEDDGTKVKELTVAPGQSLSMQRHQFRSEHWHVTSGQCVVIGMSDGGYRYPPKDLSTHDTYDVPLGEWHQLTNPYSEPCRIVEIQYGSTCSEEDIERKTS